MFVRENFKVFLQKERVKMNKLENLFNTKKIIILILSIFVIMLLVLKVIDIYNKAEFEEKKQSAKNNPMKVYETAKKVSYYECLECAELKSEEIIAVVLGVDINEEGLTYYYIDDKKVVKKIIDMFSNVEYNVANDSLTQKELDKVWTVQLIFDGNEHSMQICGFEEGYDDIEVSQFRLCNADYVSTLPDESSDVYSFAGRLQIIYEENIGEKITSTYEENVEKICKENIKDLVNSKELKTTDFLRYIHSKGKAHNFRDETDNIRVTIIYKLPVENSECYVEMEKYNEGSLGDAPANHTVVRAEIFNANGESLNLLECNEEDVEKFIK